MQSLILPTLIRIEQWVLGWTIVCLLARVLLYYVGLSLACLCVY